MIDFLRYFRRPQNRNVQVHPDLTKRLDDEGDLGEAAALTPQDLPQVVELTYRRCVWKIQADKDAYMCVERTPFHNDRRYIVVVEGAKFYQLWRRSPLPVVQVRNLMTLDYKYRALDENFGNSASSPIPLAQVSCYPRDGRDGVYFTDGLTRTLWLLANHAKAFPVLLHDEGSSLELCRLTSTGLEPSTVASLLPKE